jgi:hypothetical protein
MLVCQLILGKDQRGFALEGGTRCTKEDCMVSSAMVGGTVMARREQGDRLRSFVVIDFVSYQMYNGVSLNLQTHEIDATHLHLLT